MIRYHNNKNLGNLK